MSYNNTIGSSYVSGMPSQASGLSKDVQNSGNSSSIFGFAATGGVPFMIGNMPLMNNAMFANMRLWMQLMQNMMWERSQGIQQTPCDLSDYQKSDSADSKKEVFSPESTKSGERLAYHAQKTANFLDSKGYCARGVRMTLQSAGVDYNGVASAYQATEQLEKHPDFKEVNVPNGTLKELPAGAIVVWSKSEANPHGHISVALGDGREASDHVRPQLERLNSRSTSTYRVFLPVDKTTGLEEIA